MKHGVVILLMYLYITTFAQESNSDYDGRIIDMHFHLESRDFVPPTPLGLCSPFSNMIPHYDPKDGSFGEVWEKQLSQPRCEEPFWSPTSYDEYQSRMIEELERYKVIAMASGDPELHKDWQRFSNQPIIRGLQFRIGRDSMSPNSMETLIKNNEFDVLAEVSNQYYNITPDDERMIPYYALAEKYDIPIGIHMGSGLPGIMYHWEPEYRAKVSNPLALEEILRTFPKLRIYIMHYAEPFIDEVITMMYHYPQLYLDIGGIQWNYPRAYFYEYHLKKLVLAGFGKRIMFGSDAILWPQLVKLSIDIIQQAPFLTVEQKADIFYHNAARFLRLDDN